jgi:hypothetical protein
MELNIDKNGRIFCEGEIDYKFRCFSNAIRFSNKTSQDDFICDIRNAFNSSDVAEGEKYSQGSTNFICANKTPTCTLERLAMNIFDYHTSGAHFDRSKSGAEWWTLYLENFDDVGFHWDRDYGIEDEFDAQIHPHLGTVTYMSAVGGPTIVLDVPGHVNQADYAAQQITSCVISKPAVGKHIVFDGLMLHGAPAEIHCCSDSSSSEEESESDDENDDATEDKTTKIKNPRVTFLVNIWLNHIPIQSNTSLADSLLAKLSKDCNTVSMDFSERRQPAELTNSRDMARATWGLSEGDTDYIIEMPLPSTEELEAALQSNEGCLVRVDCSEQPGKIGIAEEDDDDDDEDDNDDDEDNSDDDEDDEVSGKYVPSKRRRVGS